MHYALLSFFGFDVHAKDVIITMAENHDPQRRSRQVTVSIFGAFTNITGLYFKTLREILRSPFQFSVSLEQEGRMSAWHYFVSGCGLLFIVWFISGIIRQGGYPAYILNVFTLLLIIMSANFYGLCAAWDRPKGSIFTTSRNIYYYTFGTFSVWSLIIIEFAELILVRRAIGRETPTCPARDMDCLLSLTGNSIGAEYFTEFVMLGLVREYPNRFACDPPIRGFPLLERFVIRFG